MTGPIRLQLFRGYTVDYRLREFRRCVWDELPEFIPFDSEQGQVLVEEMQLTDAFRWFNYLFHRNEREPQLKHVKRRVHQALREQEKRRKR